VAERSVDTAFETALAETPTAAIEFAFHPKLPAPLSPICHPLRFAFCSRRRKKAVPARKKSPVAPLGFPTLRTPQAIQHPATTIGSPYLPTPSSHLLRLPHLPAPNCHLLRLPHPPSPIRTLGRRLQAGRDRIKGAAPVNVLAKLLLILAVAAGCAAEITAAEIVGTAVVPHRIETSMRYRRPRDTNLAARVQLFVRGPASVPRFDGRLPAQLLASNDWAWHDLATAVKAPEGALTVWTFNGRSSRWGAGQSFTVEAEGLQITNLAIRNPAQWISAVTFLSIDDSVRPDTVVVHLANESGQPLQVTSLRFWLPKIGTEWQVLWPQEPLPATTVVPPGDKGFLKLRVPKLPLTYAALELGTSAGPLWTHLRIKRESFDISGGWVNEHATQEPYLKLLRHLHVNAGQIDRVPGYTDNPTLYSRYPIKLFNRLWPLEQWDTDEWLPRIHAVEFLGEPQFGGGKPVAPQEVFDKLLPYRISRLPTSVTLSEERTWRWYAGLSDYPHYDAYRVVAPAADAWGEYDRWGGRRIRWGAPLETIGDMCRSLRDLNRPVPCAYWSQGPHDGWESGWGGGGRSRRSPTPDELRSQALHALSSRITSLYWFNLSLKSLLKFPDTWEPMTRIGREIRMLEPYLLEGDAYRFERRTQDGKPDWDLASIAAPEAALLFANDTAYTADEKENVFRFGPPRAVEFEFALPQWLRGPKDVFRVDADGLHEVTWRTHDRGVTITDQRSRDAIYIATRSAKVRPGLEQRRQQALAEEAAHPIDRDALEQLKR